jgi:DNA polymerase III alpha subunit
VLGVAALGVGAQPAGGEGGVVDRVDRVDRDDLGADGRLAALARAGLALHQARFSNLPADDGVDDLVHVYDQRLTRELALIRERGAARQFLAAAAVARFARERGIGIGPGRGSAPSSLVAHVLGVTGVDPVAHGLIFERFLNARLTTAPTICLDVCAAGQAEVIDFAVERLGGTPERAGEATVLAGLGLEIAGVRGLTALRTALLRVRRSTAVELGRIPLDDPEAYRLLASGQSLDLTDSGAGPLLAALRPEHFEDLVAAIALSRPGPWGAGMTARLVALRHGEVAAEAQHPLVEPAVAGTRGLIIYQEQIMQVAATVAGYSLDEADVLRRALGKGRPEAVSRERDRFIIAAIHAGVSWVDAVLVFSRLQRAGPLSFNRGHAVASGLLLYWGAWLQARGALSSPGA